MIVYSGHQKEHKNVLCVLLTKLVAKSMVGFHALSDMLVILKISIKPFNLVIIQVYAPTSADEDVEQFYNGLDSTHKQAGSQVMTVVGDLNVKSTWKSTGDGAKNHIDLVQQLYPTSEKLSWSGWWQ